MDTKNVYIVIQYDDGTMHHTAAMSDADAERFVEVNLWGGDGILEWHIIDIDVCVTPGVYNPDAGVDYIPF